MSKTGRTVEHEERENVESMKNRENRGNREPCEQEYMRNDGAPHVQQR